MAKATAVEVDNHQNPYGYRSYQCALLGLIPPLGVLFGLSGLILGVFGFRWARKTKGKPGIGYSVVAMVAGFIELIFQSIGLVIIVTAK
ncbi:MAG: hypothetical protein R3B84_05790 [Zavarzinella sp.]